MKKLFLLLLLGLVAAPASAYDFGVVGIIAAIGGTAIGVAALVGTAPALATLAIGAAVMGITFDKTESTGAPITVQISPSAKMQTPDGWTSPSAGSSEPTPPASSASTSGWGSAMNNIPVQPDVASYQAAARTRFNQPYATCSLVDDGVNASYIHCAYSIYFSHNSDYISTACQPGYSNQGGSCTLSNPALVMKPSDGVCGIKRTGNEFSDDPRDPDCSNKPLTVSVAPNSVTQSRADGSTKTITINADGSVTIQETRPNSSTNTTETNTTNISAPDASGDAKVSGQGSGSTTGTGTAGTSNPVPVFDKSGLATEGTQAGIKSDTAAIKDALTGEGVDSSLATQKSAFDSAVDGIIGMFSGEAAKDSGIVNDFSLSSFLPTQCGCTPLTMTILGKTRSYDWCTPLDVFKNALGWVIGLFTAIYIFSLFKIGGGK